MGLVKNLNLLNYHLCLNLLYLPFTWYILILTQFEFIKFVKISPFQYYVISIIANKISNLVIVNYFTYLSAVPNTSKRK